MAGKLESKGPKADFLLWKPAVNSKLSQTGMEGHHKVKYLQKQKLIMMVVEGGPPAGSVVVQVIPK